MNMPIDNIIFFKHGATEIWHFLRKNGHFQKKNLAKNLATMSLSSTKDLHLENSTRKVLSEHF